MVQHYSMDNSENPSRPERGHLHEGIQLTMNMAYMRGIKLGKLMRDGEVTPVDFQELVRVCSDCELRATCFAKNSKFMNFRQFDAHPCRNDEFWSRISNA